MSSQAFPSRRSTRWHAVGAVVHTTKVRRPWRVTQGQREQPTNTIQGKSYSRLFIWTFSSDSY